MESVVVFLHAFPLDARMWARQVAGLPRGVRGIALDCPGFGGRPPGTASLEGFAADILARLDAEGARRFVLVGLSMGGYVAFRLVAQAPERVAGLVLCDTRAAPDDEAARARRTAQAARVRNEGVGWMADAMTPALLCEATSRARPDVVAVVRAMIGAQDREGVARALEALRDRPDSTPMLEGLAMPVLALAGAEDGLSTSHEMEGMVRAIPGATLQVLPGAGHLSNLEAPVAFGHALHAFLARSCPGRP